MDFGKMGTSKWIAALLLCPRSFCLDDPGFEAISLGRTSFRGTEGALTYNDAMVLNEMARQRCKSIEQFRYAEVGSYLGLSATIVATACPNAMVFAHDLFPEIAEDLTPGSFPPPNADDLLTRFWDGIRRNGLEGRVVPMRGRSVETLRVHQSESLDMAFVDGDHSFEGTLSDLKQLWSKLKPGGALWIHDVVRLEDGTDHPARAAAITFSSELGTKLFDVFGTWGLAVFIKDSNLPQSQEYQGMTFD
jgi:hypothetical protein